MSFVNKIKGLKEVWQFDNRWHLLVWRLFFPREKINVYQYKGLEILIDHAAGDANGAREVLATDMYRQYLGQMNFRGPARVLDLGANNGGFPLLLSSENIALEKLAAVEFNPQTFNRMRFNVERNLACEQVLLNVAVGGENRVIDASFGSKGTADNIYRAADGRPTVKIDCLTFDEIYRAAFAGETIDVCKMDVEGAEFEVFRGGNCENLRKCRYLLIEIHHEPGRERGPALEKLKELGFREIGGESKTDEHHHVHFLRNEKMMLNV